MRCLNYLFWLVLCTVSSVCAQTTKEISVQSLGTLAIYPQRSAPATVISLNQPDIGGQINARLEFITVRVGDRVKAGDSLARLDCREYELALKSVQAQKSNISARLKLAESRLSRTESLVADRLLSQDDLEAKLAERQALEADMQDVQARLDLAQLNVERCTIRAPFDALVLERRAQSGQWLVVGNPVVRLLDLSRVEVAAQIFAADAMLIDADTRFKLESNDLLYSLELRTLVDAIDPTTRNREARFEFSEGESLIGSAGKVLWNDPRPHLPAEFLIDRNGQLGSFIYKDGRAVFVPIDKAQPGRSNPVNLSLDTLVITWGYQGLTNGEQVTQRAAD